MSDAARAGWAGTVDEFLGLDRPKLVYQLGEHTRGLMLHEADAGQIEAWRGSVDSLTEALREVVAGQPESGSCGVVLEFELPRERGRRPDAVLLLGQSIVVCEFKGWSSPLQAHIDQVKAYARDLSAYHAASHDLAVVPMLVLGKGSLEADDLDGVHLTNAGALADALSPCFQRAEPSAVDVRGWLSAPYEPLPALVTAARRIFAHEPLPAIRRASSSGVGAAVEELVDIARDAERSGSRHLALVTGVPGSGKTLVGLQFVYHSAFEAGGGHRQAVFLSGNGPLVQVLQHALKNKIFVQDVHAFLVEHGGERERLPEERVVVYDEAQRAWDAERVLGKRGHGRSEPEDFVAIGDRQPDWAMLIGLIGQGQEIHLGEEGGIDQWNVAIAGARNPWTVHCPPGISDVFTSAATLQVSSSLALDETLRSHLAGDVDRWVEDLLRGDHNQARARSLRIASEGFDLYVTRDLEAATIYVRERYAGEEDKRYGLLASSKAKNLVRWGLDGGYNRFFRTGEWYNDPPESPRSCCQLKDAASEFSCQGLELDMPIVGWGSDLTWQGGAWVLGKYRSRAHDPARLRTNSYRVLLTRGRDGTLLFVPPEPEMDTTYDALVAAGARYLSAAPVAQAC